MRPPVGQRAGQAPGGGQDGTYLTLDFTRENPYAPAKLYVEYGDDLAGWTQVEIPAANGTIGGDIESR